MSTVASTVAKIQAASAEAQAIGSIGVPAPGNFEARSTAPGVVRSWVFDNALALNSGAPEDNCVLVPSNDGLRVPVIDTAMLCEGRPTMRVDCPGNSTARPGGYWRGNFSSDLSVSFGENSTFFMQTRMRVNAAMINTAFRAIGGGQQGGWKLFDLFAGDVYGGPNPTAGGITRYGTSSELKLVGQTYWGHGHPILYRYYRGVNSNLFEDSNSPIVGDKKHQNGSPQFAKCLYTKMGTVGPNQNVPGCWSMVADEFMTFQVGLSMGARGTLIDPQTGQLQYVFHDSIVELWAARDGQPSQKLLDYRPGIPGYDPLSAGPPSQKQKYGTLTLMPYWTNKDPTQAHPLCQAWYGPTIISTQRIADVA